MPTKKATTKQATIEVVRIDRGELALNILGRSPFIYHALGLKARRELLLPAGRKTNTEKQSMLKHNPLDEYRDSVYRAPENFPTALSIPAEMFKASMCSAALDMPGVTKSQIGRLTYVTGSKIPVYGVPQLWISAVRSADQNRTPDMRTRAILANWACQIRIKYIRPNLREQSVANLIAAAGMISGVGDFRVEKGKGNYGQFDAVAGDDKEFQAIVKVGGRDAQLQALDSPEFYDIDSRELFDWWQGEAKRRGFIDKLPLQVVA